MKIHYDKIFSSYFAKNKQLKKIFYSLKNVVNFCGLRYDSVNRHSKTTKCVIAKDLSCS